MKKRISAIKRLIYPETLIIGIFMLFHLIESPNRYYLIAVTFLLVALYKVSGNFLNTFWLAFLATLPFERGKYYDFAVGDLTLNAAILFSDVLLAAVVYLLLSRYKRFRGKYLASFSDLPVFVSLFLFVVFVALSVSFSRFPFNAGYFYLQLSKLVFLFFVSRIIFTDTQVIKKTLQVLALFVMANALLVVGQYLNRGPLGLNVEDPGFLYGWFASETPTLYRPGGFSVDPNIAATLFSVFVPIILINTLVTNKLWPPVSWAGLGIIFLALVFTGSRAAWAVTGLSVIATVWFIRGLGRIYIPTYLQRRWKVFAASFLILLGPLVVNRLSTLGSIFQAEGGGTYRIRHLEVGWHYLKAQPLGVGIGSFPFSMALDFPPLETGLIPTLNHNFLAQIGAEAGFLGLIAFSAFLWFIVRRKYISIKERKNPFVYSMFLAFISIVLLITVFPWFLHPGISWLFWILAGYNGAQKL